MIPRKGEMPDNMKCWSIFDTTVATATGLQFDLSVVFTFLFLHILVFKQELGPKPWTMHIWNSKLREQVGLLAVCAMFHKLCRLIGRLTRVQYSLEIVFPHFNILWTTINPPTNVGSDGDLVLFLTFCQNVLLFLSACKNLLVNFRL